MLQEKEYSTKDIRKIKSEDLSDNELNLHIDKINRDIKMLGADWYDFLVPETQIMPYVVHSNEDVLGLVYGRYQQVEGDIVGRGVLIATPDRVILIDKKPLFARVAEISYTSDKRSYLR
jgi:hypothetical protein